MGDTSQNQQDDFAEDITTDDVAVDADDAGVVNAPPAEEAPTSPLVKLLKSFGGKKKPVASGAPAPGKAAQVPATQAKAAASAPKNMPPRAPVAMPSGPLVTITTRNEFYRDGFRNLIRIAMLEAIIIVGLVIAFIFFIGTGKSQDRYFATTADGRIMQLLPLDQPNMTTAALMSWVAQATSEIMTFGYSDYQRRLQQSSRHFTHHGWETFTTALQQSHIIDAMQAGKEVLTASPRNAPILVQEGMINGKYRWIVKLPLQVNYDSVSSSRKDNLNVTLVIERVPSLENPSGVGIEQWISTQG
jgi:intracellular multiplication protein IcmL